MTLGIIEMKGHMEHQLASIAERKGILSYLDARNKPRAMPSLLGLLIGSNIADAVFTYTGYVKGILLEENPILRWFLESGHFISFFVFKLGLCFVSSMLLWIGSEVRPRFTVAATTVLCILFCMLCMYHINGMIPQ